MDGPQIHRLLEHLGLLNVRISRHGSGDQVEASCPFHSDTNPSFAVSISKENHPVNCFAGCFSGTLLGLIRKMLSCSGQEALDYANNFGNLQSPVPTSRLIRPLDFDEIARPFQKTSTDFDWKSQARFFCDQFGRMKLSEKKALRLFLRSDGRHLRPGNLPRGSVGWDRRMSALVFPWTDGSKVVGLSARRIDTDENAKFYYDGFKNPGDALYLPHFSGDLDPLYVVEGPLDAIAIWAHTGHAACAVGRASVSQAQAQILVRLAEHVVLLLDPDAAGTRGAFRAFERLQSSVSVSIGPVRRLGPDASRTPRASLRRWLGRA